MNTTINSVLGLRQVLAFLAIFGLLMSMSQGIFVSFAEASNHQITICHATGGDTYSAPNPTKAQIVADVGSSDANAHGSFVAGVHPDDIIPPFPAGSHGGQSWESYPGKNWDTGEVIWNGGNCNGSVQSDLATITIVKTVVNDGGGTADADNFVYKIDGNVVSQGQAIEVTAGAHTLSEDDDADYTEGVWGGSCDPNGSITVADGSDYSCTITNTYIPPQTCDDDTAVNYGKEETCKYESEVTICKYDGSQNPLGGWTVGLQQGQTSITGVTAPADADAPGCVTLVNWLSEGGNIPYGSYTLTETMKEGWVNISGNGDSVEIDAPTESFSLVNREKGPDEIPGCTDEKATNFDPKANVDNGSCEYPKTDVTLCKVGGTGVPMANWTLKLDELSGETVASEDETNGCVVFTDIPHGEHVIDEVMKSDRWINVAGDGYVTKGETVEVNELNNTFTLKNRECEEGTIARENQCVPVDPDKETITMCKYDGDDEPVSGWGMTLTNRDDVTFDDLVTGENGCVDQEVDPEDGPWYVIEESRTDWTQASVVATGGNEQVTDFGTICRFFPKFTNDNPTSAVAVEIPQDPTYRCDFTNSYENPEPPVCRIGNNLLTNPSFEDPAIGGAWSISAITDWVITKVSDSSSTLGELWRGLGQGPSDGEQNVELGANEATQLTQTAVTVPGATYELRFDFAARQGTDAADNSIDALVDGSVLMNANGDDTNWTTYSETFVADNASTDIAFKDVGVPDNSYGSLLDNAVLCLVKDPEPAEACEITVVSDTTNTVADAPAALAWVHPNWITGLTDSVAQWIWGSQFVTDPAVEETQTFTKTFNWNGPVTSALLDIAADNTYSVKVNGSSVATDVNPDNFSAADEDIDVASYIQTGINTIEITVTNLAAGTQDPQANPAGLLYNLTIVGDTETDCTYVPNETPKLTCDLFSNKTVVSKGETFTLGWNTELADYVEIDNGIGSVATTSGSIDRSIESDTTFTLTAWDGEDSVQCPVIIDVEEETITTTSTGGGGGGGGGSSAPRCELFGAERDGDQVNLNWKTTRGSDLVIKVDGKKIFSTDDNDEVDEGSFVYEDAGDSEFELTVSRGTRERSCTARVVRPTPQILGEQVSLVPQGAPDTGAGGTSHTIPQIAPWMAMFGNFRLRDGK